MKTADVKVAVQAEVVGKEEEKMNILNLVAENKKLKETLAASLLRRVTRRDCISPNATML